MKEQLVQILTLQQSFTMNEELACPKCKKAFDQENPPKKLINCSHSLCFACLKEELVCPIDRTRIEKRKYTIEAFQTNQELLNSIILSKNTHSNTLHTHKRIQSHIHNKPAISHNSNNSNNSNTSNTSKNSNRNEFNTPIIENFSAKGVYERQKDAVEVEVACVSPEKQNQNNRLIISPKKVRLSFDTCLLHSKKADLVCLEDRCLICANCGLFGEHKLHKIIPYDEFLSQYSRVTEEAFRLYEQLKQRQDKLSESAISNAVQEALKECRDSQSRHIRTTIAAYIDSLRRLEKQLMVELDIAVGVKRKKLLETCGLSQLAGKKERYIAQIEAMSNGVDDIFNLENIGQYIDYIDKDSPSSFIVNQGEYLLVQIDNHHRTQMQTITQQANDIYFQFSLPLEALKDMVTIQSQDAPQMAILIEEARKKQPKLNPYPKAGTPHRPINPHQSNSVRTETKMSPRVKPQDDPLLIGSNSKSGSKGSSGKVKQHSPIHPYAFDFDLSKELSAKQVQLSGCKQIEFKAPLLPINEFNTGPSLSRCRLDSSRTHKSKSKSTISDRQGMVLIDKNENTRRKKLQLPEKYQRVYQQLQRDKLEVLDLGGAFLGETAVLSICQLLPSRSKLRIAKLMNNKITDEAFPQVVIRCRNLTSLNLSYNLLTEKSLEWLEEQAQQLGELKNITLSNNKIVLRNVRDRLQSLSRRGIKVSL